MLMQLQFPLCKKNNALNNQGDSEKMGSPFYLPLYHNTFYYYYKTKPPQNMPVFLSKSETFLNIMALEQQQKKSKMTTAENCNLHDCGKFCFRITTPNQANIKSNLNKVRDIKYHN